MRMNARCGGNTHLQGRALRVPRLTGEQGSAFPGCFVASCSMPRMPGAKRRGAKRKEIHS